MIKIFYTIGLLCLSNIFMAFAWYGHLKFTNKNLFIVIIISWSIAFFEYCLQVPANRIGYSVLSGLHLKVIQEIISFSVFIGFSYFYLQQKITTNQLLGVVIICIGSFLVFKK